MFKVGDLVECIDGDEDGELEEGEVYEILSTHIGCFGDQMITVDESGDEWYSDRFKLYKRATNKPNNLRW